MKHLQKNQSPIGPQTYQLTESVVEGGGGHIYIYPPIDRAPFRHLYFSRLISGIYINGSFQYLLDGTYINVTSLIVRNADDNNYYGTLTGGPTIFSFISAFNDETVARLKFIVESDTNNYFILNRDTKSVTEINGTFMVRWSTSDGGAIGINLKVGKQFGINEYDDIQDNSIVFNY